MSKHHRAKRFDPRKARPIIAAQLPAPCIDCARPVYPTQAWDVGHRIPISDPHSSNELSNLGPSHTRCNRSAGGKLGAAVQGKQVRDERRLITW